MEKNINLAKILNGKPVNTKLWSPLFGDVYTSSICSEDTIIVVNHHAESSSFYNNGKYFDHAEAEPLLFPSKEMRDWGKFAWKKGDLLINSCGFQCIFKEWASDDYTKFNGCYSNSRDGYEDVLNAETAKFDKLDNNTAYGYIREIENRCGGKLNLETLEIEKPEFKDGDIVTIMLHIGDKLIYLFKAEDDEKYYGHAFLDGNIAIVNEDSYCQKDFCTARSSTEEEKQQLFEALAKKGKAWDAEKKQIVDIKKELQFKPFEKVLVRDSYNDMWRASFFSHITEDDGRYVTTCCTWKFCIPYIGNEHLLGTTKDVEG